GGLPERRDHQRDAGAQRRRARGAAPLRPGDRHQRGRPGSAPGSAGAPSPPRGTRSARRLTPGRAPRRPMRIIYFGHYSALTGYGRACRDYCAALQRAGHDLQIVDWQSIPGNTERAAGAPAPRLRALDDFRVPWPLALGRDDVAIVRGWPRLLATVMAQGALPMGGWLVAMTTW